MARIRDLDLSFDNNPVTGDVSSVTDFNAIRKSLSTLLQTQFLDKPFREDIGSNIPLSLFDTISPSYISTIRTRIRSLIERNEPRVILNNVDVVLFQRDNRVEITVDYTIKKTAEQDQYTTVINASE
jgi:phage baseplate assembly protein W